MSLISKILKTTIMAAFLAVIFVTFTHVQDISDWYKLRNYTAPASVKAFTTQDAMSPYAIHMFYINHPAVESNVSAFRAKCAIAEQTIVLGCYKGNQYGIEIYNVKDPRLNGVQQVTAAHEMLHAVYDRLSVKEKDNVDAMLQDYYQNKLSDPRIKDTINAYKKTEPNDVVNEMHSVFGTEIADLPAPLEQYYQKYFTNRALVTAYAASYEGEFTSRKYKIDADDQQLSILHAQVQIEENNLQNQLAGLQTDRANVENSNSEAVVSAYNARVNAYNAGVRKLQSDIAAYNALVVARNALAAELDSLQSSLDTRLTAQAAQ